MNKGNLIVVSGFSGAGKGTVMNRLISEKEGYALSVSATTRGMRPGETDGVSYFFKTREEFENMIKEDAFVEYACYVGNYYGTPKAFVEEKISEGKDVLLEIEIQGALKIKEKFPSAVLIFITTKDAKTLKDRLTGRGMRPGETDGVSYFFKTREEFENMIKEDAFVEYACYVGNYYGTPKAFVEEKISEGKDVLLEIEIQGALKIKEKFPSAVLIFITTKDAKTLKDRLTGRGTETEDVIEKRLNRAAEEAKGVEAYDYIVVNDILEDCVETVDRIIKSEHNRTSEKISVIEDIRKELSKHTV